MSLPTARNDELFKRFGQLLFEDLKRSLEEVDYGSIKTIFFGGGTPSLMFPEDIERIITFLRNKSTFQEIEISLEANPATFDKQKLLDFRVAGINRISLGIQSFSDTNLKFLGRIYNANQALNAAETVANVFDNFSFDFIYGYECQNLDSFAKDLKIAQKFGCKHISCYQLTFEERTPFYKQLQEGVIKSICEKDEVDFYQFIGDFLKQNGIFRYEVSNYAIPGFECKHNMAYWKYEDYLGVGPAAHGRITVSDDHSDISKNFSKYATEKIHDPYKWANAVKNEGETYAVYNKLSDEEILQEILIMRLRLTEEWLDLKKLEERVSMTKKVITEEKLNFLTKNGLLNSKGSKIKLTSEGILKMNSIVRFLMNL